MIFAGNLKEDSIEHVAQQCAKFIANHWPEQFATKKQLRPYVDPTFKHMSVWGKGEITLQEVVQTRAPRHETQTQPHLRAIDEIGNHPMVDVCKPYKEMMTELVHAELYNKDKAKVRSLTKTNKRQAKAIREA